MKLRSHSLVGHQRSRYRDINAIGKIENWKRNRNLKAISGWADSTQTSDSVLNRKNLAGAKAIQ